MTKCSASLLAVAASCRKFELRGSFSKYSTRHGHQSVSMSRLGNSIDLACRRVPVAFCKAKRLEAASTFCEIKITCGKVEPLSVICYCYSLSAFRRYPGGRCSFGDHVRWRLRSSLRARLRHDTPSPLPILSNSTPQHPPGRGASFYVLTFFFQFFSVSAFPCFSSG